KTPAAHPGKPVSGTSGKGSGEMGRHLPFSFAEDAPMVVESEEIESTHPIECPVLVTERLVLRPPHQDDIPELADLANNRRVAEMLSRMPYPYTPADAEQFVEGTPRACREDALHEAPQEMSCRKDEISRSSKSLYSRG